MGYDPDVGGVSQQMIRGTALNAGGVFLALEISACICAMGAGGGESRRYSDRNEVEPGVTRSAQMPRRPRDAPPEAIIE